MTGTRPGRLLLIGMMGAGKTTVGRLLAGRLGWDYSDSDELVEGSTGRTVAELWAASGEAAFRVEETRVLLEALGLPTPAVISVAGGAVLDPANRELLARSGPVVWLRADLGTLLARIGDGGGHRPLLAGDPAGVLARLEAERRPLYQALADEIVDVDGLDPGAVADEVLARLAPSGSRT